MSWPEGRVEARLELAEDTVRLDLQSWFHLPLHPWLNSISARVFTCTPSTDSKRGGLFTRHIYLHSKQLLTEKMSGRWQCTATVPRWSIRSTICGSGGDGF